jgi:hypothetical protein
LDRKKIKSKGEEGNLYKLEEKKGIAGRSG